MILGYFSVFPVFSNTELIDARGAAASSIHFFSLHFYWHSFVCKIQNHKEISSIQFLKCNSLHLERKFIQFELLYKLKFQQKLGIKIINFFKNIDLNLIIITLVSSFVTLSGLFSFIFMIVVILALNVHLLLFI